MLHSLCTLPHHRPMSSGNPSNSPCSATAAIRAADRRARRGLTIPAGATLLATFFVGATGLATLRLGVPVATPVAAKVSEQPEDRGVVSVPRLGDGVLLIRTDANGRREIRTISSLSSPLLKDLSATEIALVETALASLVAGPKCLTETGSGGITCQNVTCLGDCFIDGFAVDPDSGAIMQYQLVGETIDTQTVPTPTVALCGCM